MSQDTYITMSTFYLAGKGFSLWFWVSCIFGFFCFPCERKQKPLKCIKKNSIRTGPGNAGKYLNFSLAFSSTGKSLKMVGGPGKSWISVNSSNKVLLKDIKEQPDGKIQQLKNYGSWKSVSENGYETCKNKTNKQRKKLGETPVCVVVNFALQIKKSMNNQLTLTCTCK